MNQVPHRSTYGQSTKFLRQMYWELHQAGYSHQVLVHLSLSKALRARFGSETTTDLFLGMGTAKGIKEACGYRSQWRKLWSRVQSEGKRILADQRLALARLEDSLVGCEVAGLSKGEILAEVRSRLLRSGVITPLTPAQQPPGIAVQGATREMKVRFEPGDWLQSPGSCPGDVFRRGFHTPGMPFGIKQYCQFESGVF